MEKENLPGNGPSWIAQEQERLSKKPQTIQAQAGPRRPSITEVALGQLKQDVIREKIKADPTYVPDHFDGPEEVNQNSVIKIIERIRTV
jgi:hypothetical protein